ncbi:hypothetical protein GCK72_025196 [Caenorhabditis remanei]|uniref:Uncharacterized protein n=1 Tax=Caenorhabditis remanei TaxID=31234 RepID=A0A6A5G2H1_CAERE|nr:hypothetical protein GCK72_025196 [Caenorhabditis remanei]KAF1748729.1 hypothetical protein GCK72_025196 [Caenorhabditis remanei]
MFSPSSSSSPSSSPSSSQLLPRSSRSPSSASTPFPAPSSSSQSASPTASSSRASSLSPPSQIGHTKDGFLIVFEFTDGYEFEVKYVDDRTSRIHYQPTRIELTDDLKKKMREIKRIEDLFKRFEGQMEEVKQLAHPKLAAVNLNSDEIYKVDTLTLLSSKVIEVSWPSVLANGLAIREEIDPKEKELEEAKKRISELEEENEKRIAELEGVVDRMRNPPKNGSTSQNGST